MTTEIVHAEATPATAVSPIGHIKRLQEAMGAIQQAKDELLTEGTDYGLIPGTDKPTLFQPGSELLLKLFGYGFKYEVEERIEDWDTPFFRYQVKGIVVDGLGNTVAEGPGEANSREGRYLRRQCPKCESGVWDNRKQQAQGKFTDQAPFTCKNKQCDFTGKKPSDVPEIFDFALVNTMMKMAVKRAKVAATLTSTGGSHFFTQDVEDLPDTAANVDAPAQTSRGSQNGSGASQTLECPACGSKVWDNRDKIASGQFSEKSPKFSCSNKDGCTGVTADGEVVTDGDSGKPWVTWHEHYFDPKPDGAGLDTDELKEVQGHISTGSITESAVLSIARRVSKEKGEDQPTSLDGIGQLSPEAQSAIAEAVAEKVVGE
jgi:hypothetical protein